MSSTTRLERFKKNIQADLAKLPDRPVAAECDNKDDDTSGGVSLLPPVTASQATPSAPSASVKDNPEQRFVLVPGVASSYNPGVDVQAPAPRVQPVITRPRLPATDLNRGDLVSAHHHFTPILALSRYPYRFCNQQYSQDIASAFFDQGKFWQREWDLYYIWDIEPIKPLVLVRESQFQDLLNEINSHFQFGLRITDAQREDSLVTKFPDHPDCLPRYLGRSQSRDQYDNMTRTAPERGFRSPGERPRQPPDSGTLEQFKQQMQELWDVQKAKNKAARAKKHEERLVKQKSMADSFKRGQRYLGLRKTELANGSSASVPSVAIDPLLPAPHAFDQDVVFVCVDVESYERCHSLITEVGVATLDTRVLKNVAPGKDGEAWKKYIKARHFRIKEYSHLINREFVHGCPDRFDYGRSTLIPLAQASNQVAACFRSPFGADISNTKGNDLFAMYELTEPGEKRNIVLLGHDTLSDVRYLQHLGYDPMKTENIIEAMDTATLYRVWRREQQTTNLGRILTEFDIAGWNLHNAGNDAVFTVQAMLAICVREAMIRGTPELVALREEDKAARLQAAHEFAEQRAKDDAEGWSDNEKNGDGGDPVPLQ